MHFEEFSTLCQKAFDKLRVSEILKMIESQSKNNDSQKIINIDFYEYGIMPLAFWQMCSVSCLQGYFIALGVSREEAFHAAYFAFKHNFWLNND